MSVISQHPARTGRIQEFGLLVIAFALGLISWILVSIGVSPSANIQVIPNNFALVAGILAVVVFGAHVLIRKLAPWADPVLFPIAVALNGLGLVMIHRIDTTLVKTSGKTEVGSQLVLSVVGVVLMLGAILLIRDHRKLRKYTYISLLAGIALLLLPMLPVIGKQINGARLWIRVAGFSFQPAELAKIAFVIFFAGYLISQRDNLALAGKKILGIQLPQLRHFAPILVAWAASLAILALEKDFGTALLFFGLFVAVLYVATERVSWLIIGGILSTVGIYVIVQLMPHIQARFTVWLHALDGDVYDQAYGSYQLVQGLFGMASGGLFGTGWGNGYPTKSYASNSDFIIPSFGEELGMIGLLAILGLYLILVFRAFSTGIHLRDGFGKLLAAGFGFAIALQCFVVVGGVTRVIPLTGLAMPFLALGGSALLANWIIIGVLIRMSDDARRPVTPVSTPLSAIDTANLRELIGDDAVSTDAASDASLSERGATASSSVNHDSSSHINNEHIDEDDGNSQLTEVVRL
ncbi:cell division protein FtsW (lipid II flippase) [Arcanobacterium pluranimalium]|uniref:FtsW/RodA/SpoVE family cell cycle protein n=1 Tax=Arcanobacterium pluranimalium TaxID=108028 RepID=UPI00195E8845|nr:FtsW/RodA/SpoVE family cell cycle protein [Arcanobacterium pluranimalium]MBM7824420.1 cell division protein FtsW (lipid II flippase) [Arcanobacterium pluranimalium]